MAATIDKDLTTTLKAARGGKPMRFAFFPKGAEGKLLVGKKIPAQEIAETKKATGAGSVLKGRCVGEDGTLVFYVVKVPPGTLYGQLRKRLKDDAGLTWPIEIRVSADAEAELAEGDAEAAGGAAAAPGTPASPRAGWEKALAEVEPAYLQALRDQPDKASALRAVMGFAQGKAAKEDFAGDVAALRKLAEQLGKTPAGIGGKAAPKPEPVSLEAAYQRRVQELADDLKKAVATGSDAGKEAKLRFSEAQVFARKQDFAQATALLDVVEQQIKKALAGAPAGGDVAAQWKAKLAEYTPALKAALAAKGPNAAAIAKLLAQANALSKPGGNIALAIEKLTECHALATNAPPGPDLAAFQAKARQVKALIEQLGPDYDFREQDLAYVDEVLAMADSMPDEILRVLDEKEQELREALAAKGPASAGEPGAATAQPTENQAEPQTEPQTPTARPEAASPSPPPTGQQAPIDAAALQAEYERRVLALEPKVFEAEKTRKGQAKWLMLFMSAQDRGSDGEFAKALQILDKLEALLKAPTETTSKAEAALQQWQAACTEVRNQLRKVQAEITKAKDTNSAGAVLRLESVVKNLAFEPSTQQDVVELEGWIQGDDVITAVEEPNPWGLPVQIRERLLPVLAALKTQMQE